MLAKMRASDMLSLTLGIKDFFFLLVASLIFYQKPVQWSEHSPGMGNAPGSKKRACSGISESLDE